MKKSEVVGSIRDLINNLTGIFPIPFAGLGDILLGILEKVLIKVEEMPDNHDFTQEEITALADDAIEETMSNIAEIDALDTDKDGDVDQDDLDPEGTEDDAHDADTEEEEEE